LKEIAAESMVLFIRFLETAARKIDELWNG